MENPRQPGSFPQPGQEVQIVDGPFGDFDGVVESVNEEKGNALVAVSFFGRPTPVLLLFNQIEPLDNSNPRPF
jgi:transcriptional antiterminator NusG